jgi:hypothetical protein
MMDGEQELRDELTIEWFNKSRHQHHLVEESFARLLSFASWNMASKKQPETAEEIQLKIKVESFIRPNSWGQEEFKWAYAIAHQKLLELAIENKIIIPC